MTIPSGLWITKRYNKSFTRQFFKWYDLGLLGVGEECKPYINLDPYVQLPDNAEEIHNEVMDALNNTEPNSGTGICMVPTYINNQEMPSYYSFNADQFLSTEELENIKTASQMDNLIFDKTPAIRIWEKTIMARVHLTDYWQGKNYDSCKWVRDDFPILKEWIESLRASVFEQIGRVSIFANNQNSPIWIHRDNPLSGSSLNNHFINVRLSKRSTRPFFMFDEVKNKKYYIQDCNVYMFNEWDLHGTDPEDYKDFTLRIDGKFKLEFAEAAGLKDGITWSSNYSSGKKVEGIKVYDPK
jgi:hypothetical protein